MTSDSSARPTCFIAMPMTTHPEEAKTYSDDEHWSHVMETLFIPAIEEAGFRAIEPTAQGSDMIHGRIIEHLSTADMVLCDLSGWNPNVFFELGVRTSLNMPIALVRDEKTKIPFDTNGLNTHLYASSLLGWELAAQRDAIADHLRAAVTSCAGENPMWRRFGLTITADQPVQDETSTDARLELILNELNEMRRAAEPVKSPVQHQGDWAIAPSDGPVDQLARRIGNLLDAWSWTRTPKEDGTIQLDFVLLPQSVPMQELLRAVAKMAFEAGWKSIASVSPAKDHMSVVLRPRT